MTLSLVMLACTNPKASCNRYNGWVEACAIENNDLSYLVFNCDELAEEVIDEGEQCIDAWEAYADCVTAITDCDDSVFNECDEELSEFGQECVGIL